jgi:23S rRNA pseudouridine1911/1915/1917 synthase
MRVGEDIPVLFEDNHCLAVLKPSRLLVASDVTGDETLLALCREYVARSASGKGYVAPLHFLDRPVSGIVLFAKSSKAASRLSEQFRSHRMRKVYRAVVEKIPAPASGLLEDYLWKDEAKNLVTVVSAETRGAKPCSLEYRVLSTHDGRALLEILPRTGRSHQIRVQLSSRGWSIAGDTKYGARLTTSGWIALHAFELTFEHPTQRVPVTVHAGLPEAWREVYSKLEA